MARAYMSRFPVRSQFSVALRYGGSVFLVAAALGLASLLRHDNLPHPFVSFSFAAIAITFWFAGSGPGLLALLVSYVTLSHIFVPGRTLSPSSQSYLVIYGIFGAAVGWFSASRRRAERLLTDARDHLELRVAKRTNELTHAIKELQDIQAELRQEKDRLKLLLDLSNSIVSKLDLRDLLRDISASVRRLMHCDAVGFNLPDSDTGELKLLALDFPGAKGFLREETVRSPNSLPAMAFNTGEPKTFSVGHDIHREDSYFEKE